VTQTLWDTKNNLRISRYMQCILYATHIGK
jgi:hypothetical protein